MTNWVQKYVHILPHDPWQTSSGLPQLRVWKTHHIIWDLEFSWVVGGGR